MIRVTIRVIWTLVLNTEIAQWIEHSTKILVPFNFLQDFCWILRIPGPLKLTSLALVLCSIILGPLNHKLVSFLVPVPCHCWLSIVTCSFCLQNKSDSWRFGKVRVCSPDRNLYQNTSDQNKSLVITVKSILLPFLCWNFTRTWSIQLFCHINCYCCKNLGSSIGHFPVDSVCSWNQRPNTNSSTPYANQVSSLVQAFSNSRAS